MIEELGDPIFIDGFVRNGLRDFLAGLKGYGFHILLPFYLLLSDPFVGSVFKFSDSEFVIKLNGFDFRFGFSLNDSYFGFGLPHSTGVNGFEEQSDLLSHRVD